MFVELIKNDTNYLWLIDALVINLDRVKIVFDLDFIALFLNFKPVWFLHFNLEGSWGISKASKQIVGLIIVALRIVHNAPFLFLELERLSMWEPMTAIFLPWFYFVLGI